MAFDAGGHNEWVGGMDKGGVHDGLMAFSADHNVKGKLRMFVMDIQRTRDGLAHH